jgi:hypothetical protein
MYSNTPSDFDFKLRNEGIDPLPDPVGLSVHVEGS